MAACSNLQRGVLLAFALGGCTGNVLSGVPLDAGDELGVGQTGSVPDGGVAARDARVAGAIDDGGLVAGMGGSGDAGQPGTPKPVDAGSGASGKDAATPPAVQTDAGQPPAAGPDLSTDKTKFLGSPRCDKAIAAGVLLCDDFEQTVGANPGPDWGYPYSFKPTIDTTHAARGTRALLFSTTSGTPGHIEETKTFPAANNSFYGRMFVWIDTLPSGPNYAHWTLVGASGSGNNAEVRLDGQLETAADRGHNYYGIGTDGGDSGDWHTPGSEPQSIATEKTWTCLEWRFKGDSSETQIWIDGVEQVSLHTTSTEYRPGDAEMGKIFTHPTYQRLRIGWWAYGSDTVPMTNQTWIDEVIIDDQRIGCVL
jgi:hypothetical protein